MTVLRILAAAILLAVVCVVAGDRLIRPGRVPVGFAAERRADAALSGFHVFGWVGPPSDSIDAARIAEMSAAGFTLTLQALNDAGRVEANRRTLDLAAARGMRCIIWDHRLEDLDPDTPAGAARLDSVAADYRAHPALFGYYLGDEPPRAALPSLARFSAALRACDPEHPGWNNLPGRTGFPTRAAWLAHHREYLASVRPMVLCNDQYDFLPGRDRHEFVENAAGLAAMARSGGVPFWGIVQLVEHVGYRALTPGELRWQVSMLLAYGAHGIGYFTYWTPPPEPRFGWKPAILDERGRRTAWYPVVAEWNRKVRAAGETLSRLTWLGTVHAGSVPPGGTQFAPDVGLSAIQGRAAIGRFVGEDGTPYLVVVNSDSLAARTIGLALPSSRRAETLDGDSLGWRELPAGAAEDGIHVDLPLEAGSFALLRLSAPAPSMMGGTPPGLRVSTVTGAEVVLDCSRVGDEAGLEIVDAAGSRVWSRALPSRDGAVIWRGDRNRGGIAPAGLYFARLEDAHGFAVAPIRWEGAE